MVSGSAFAVLLVSLSKVCAIKASSSTMPVTLQLVVPPGQVHSSEAEASVARGQSFDSVLFTVMTPSSTVRTPEQLELTFPSINYSDADAFG